MKTLTIKNSVPLLNTNKITYGISLSNIALILRIVLADEDLSVSNVSEDTYHISHIVAITYFYRHIRIVQKPLAMNISSRVFSATSEHPGIIFYYT